MPRDLAIWMGLGVLLAGCGSAPLGAPAVGDAQGATLQASSLRPAASGSVVIMFRNPRDAFSSDKIELSTGKLLNVDDGMSPEGDLSFFFDGSRFQVIANAGGGANRHLAPAKAGKPTGAFAMAPIPLKEGTEVLLKQGPRLYSVTITRLEPGSMRFLPDGSGTGTGSVTFSYHSRAIETN